ncbi:MAG: hypothetical protein QOE05_1364 [Actinomycetota bacterium]|jgi:hypothetical protein|nr:hypothetical protein [Actinomycetota bacterium]
MAEKRPAVAGNWLVLAGAVLYLLEWVAIIPAGDSGPSDPGTASGKVLGLYTAHPTGVTFLATWCSVVLLGRVLLILGIRAALRSVGRDDELVGWAIAAMAISVALELVSLTATGSAAVLAERSADADLVRALDVVGGFAWGMIFGPLGIAVATAAWVMLRSRAFPLWICVVGLVGGGLGVLGGIVAGPGYLHEGIARSIFTFAQAGVALFWLWMLATGIFLVRRIRRPAAG